VLDIVGKRYWYFLLSLIIIIPGTISLITAHLKLGTDFTGGTEITFSIPQQNYSPNISSLLSKNGYTVSYVQPVVSKTCPGECQYLARIKAITPQQYNSIQSASKKAFGGKGAVSQQTVSGTIASQLTQQAILAVVVASVAILLYISFAFRQAPHPFRFGTAAVIAMLHDVLVVLGIFSILGAVANVEVDAPFVTAMLTIIAIAIINAATATLLRRSETPKFIAPKTPAGESARVRVTAAVATMSAAVSQLTAKRRQILGFEPAEKAGWDRIVALVPQAELGRYATELRTATAGLGTYAARHERFEIAPERAVGAPA